MDVKGKGNFDEEQSIYIILNCLPNCLLDAERNKTVTTGQRLESMIKTDITSVLPDVIPQKGHNSLCAIFQPIHSFNLTMRKHQTNTKRRIVYLKRKGEKTTFFKTSMSLKKRNTMEMLQIKGS